MAKLLQHITDLHLLDEAELAQFISELPGIVASLRVAARSAEEAGMKLSNVFPSLTFVPEIKEATVFRAGDQQVQVAHRDIKHLDDAQTVAKQAIEKADRSSVLTQEDLNAALFQSAASGNTMSCKLLLERGADPNAREPLEGDASKCAMGLRGNNHTALHIAAARGQTEVCKLLLKHGADLDSRNSVSYTPMYVAVREQKRNTALFLVASGATTKHFGGEPGSLQERQNHFPLRCGNIDIKGISKYKAAVCLGDLEILTEMLEDPKDPKDATFIANLAQSAKAARRPEVASFLQAKAAVAKIRAVRSGPAPTV